MPGRGFASTRSASGSTRCTRANCAGAVPRRWSWTNTNPGLALANTAADGVCSSAGGLHRSAAVPLLRMYVRNAAFYVGRTHARALIPEVLDLMVQGRLRPQDIPMHVAPLDDAIAVLREHFLGGESVKTVLRA